MEDFGLTVMISLDGLGDFPVEVLGILLTSH